MTIMWPDKVLPPQNVNFDIAPRTLAGPSSISGYTQVVASDAGLWKATFGNVVVNRRDRVLTFRAIAVLLEGRLNPILVPRCHAYQPNPGNADSLAPGFYDGVPHSDGTFFSDGTGYVGSTFSATIRFNLAIRAVSLVLDIEAGGGTIQPGQDFSIGERMYRVRSVTYSSSATATVAFRPPLREAVAAGTSVNFDKPVCRMRLASDDEMNLELQLRRFGAPTVNFIEAL